MRCAHVYPDGARCVWEGGKPMCEAHNLINRSVQKKAMKQAAAREQVAREGVPAAIRRPARQREKFGQPSRVQTAREIIDKLPDAPFYVDHSAPWRCGMTPCGRCQDKPTYEAWREAKCQVD